MNSRKRIKSVPSEIELTKLIITFIYNNVSVLPLTGNIRAHGAHRVDRSQAEAFIMGQTSNNTEVHSQTYREGGGGGSNDLVQSRTVISLCVSFD